MVDFFSSPQRRIIFYKREEWSNQKFVGSGLQVDGPGGGGHLGIFWVGICRPGLQIGTPF